MEKLTACIDLVPLQQFYDRAFTYEWNRADAGSISESFINRFVFIRKLRREGDKLFNDANFMAAYVQRDEQTGKVTIVENEAAMADQQMGEVERIGMQNDQVAPAPEESPPPASESDVHAEPEGMAPAPSTSSVFNSIAKPSVAAQ